MFDQNGVLWSVWVPLHKCLNKGCWFFFLLLEILNLIHPEITLTAFKDSVMTSSHPEIGYCNCFFPLHLLHLPILYGKYCHNYFLKDKKCISSDVSSAPKQQAKPGVQAPIAGWGGLSSGGAHCVASSVVWSTKLLDVHQQGGMNAVKVHTTTIWTGITFVLATSVSLLLCNHLFCDNHCFLTVLSADSLMFS